MSISFKISHFRIKVVVPYVGGGFGGKAGINLEPLVACLSKKAGGRPVKIVASREEEFNTIPSRQGLPALDWTYGAHGVDIIDLPITPERIWRAIKK